MNVRYLRYQALKEGRFLENSCVEGLMEKYIEESRVGKNSCLSCASRYLGTGIGSNVLACLVMEDTFGPH